MYFLCFCLVKCVTKLKDKFYFKTLGAYRNSRHVAHRFGCFAAEEIFLILAFVFQVFTPGIFRIVAFWFLLSCNMISLFQSFEGNWCLVIRKKIVDDRHIFLPCH